MFILNPQNTVKKSFIPPSTVKVIPEHQLICQNVGLQKIPRLLHAQNIYAVVWSTQQICLFNNKTGYLKKNTRHSKSWTNPLLRHVNDKDFERRLGGPTSHSIHSKILPFYSELMNIHRQKHLKLGIIWQPWKFYFKNTLAQAHFTTS
jgi:hypothetical protein